MYDKIDWRIRINMIQIENESYRIRNNINYIKLSEDNNDYCYRIFPDIFLNNDAGYILHKLIDNSNYEIYEVIDDIRLKYNIKTEALIDLRDNILKTVKYFLDNGIIENISLSSGYENKLFNQIDYNGIVKDRKDTDQYIVYSADYVITKGCNLKCKHCYLSSDSYSSDKDKLKLEDWIKISDTLIERGLMHVAITGGEPTTSPYLNQIMKYLLSKSIKISLLTNGTYIKQELLDILKEYRELINVQISLDGASSNTYGEIRNNNNIFEKIQENIKLLRDNNIKVTLSVISSKANYNEIVSGKYIELAKKLGVRSIGIMPEFVNVGRASENKDLTIGINEILNIVDYVKSIKNFDININGAPIFKKNLINTKEYPSCSRGINSLFVSYDGIISVCTGFKEIGYSRYILGNYFIDNFNSIFDKYNNISEERLDSYKHIKGVCSICTLNPYCAGWCRVNSYSIYKDINAPSPLCQKLYENNLFPKEFINQNKEYIEL